MRKGTRNAYTIGTQGVNYWGVPYKIIGYTNNPRERVLLVCDTKQTHKTISIASGKFKTGFEKDRNGGYLGAIEHGTAHPLYWRWQNMMGRCYDKNHANYQYYGARGVSVSDELKCFANYVDVVSRDPHYKDLLNNPRKWQVDKDLRGKRQYSTETIVIITTKQNVHLAHPGTPIIATKGDVSIRFDNIPCSEAVIGARRENIARAVRQGKSIKGWVVKYA